MHAMTRNVPPHTPQRSMSMWKTRLSRCIQLMGARRDAGGSHVAKTDPLPGHLEPLARECEPHYRRLWEQRLRA